MMRRSPKRSASSMLCVTMSVVRPRSATMDAVRSMMVAATLGSSAAVCSSSSSRLGSATVAMSSDMA